MRGLNNAFSFASILLTRMRMYTQFQYALSVVSGLIHSQRHTEPRTLGCVSILPYKSNPRTQTLDICQFFFGRLFQVTTSIAAIAFFTCCVASKNLSGRLPKKSTRT